MVKRPFLVAPLAGIFLQLGFAGPIFTVATGSCLSDLYWTQYQATNGEICLLLTISLLIFWKSIFGGPRRGPLGCPLTVGGLALEGSIEGPLGIDPSNYICGIISEITWSCIHL